MEIRTLEQHALNFAEYAVAPAKKSRGATYQKMNGNDYQCPHCWVHNGVHSKITPSNRGHR